MNAHRSLGRILNALLIVLLCAGFTAIPPAAPTAIKVLVVFLKLSAPFCSTPEACLPDFGQNHIDSVHNPRHTGSVYVSMLNNTMSNYIKEATFNNANVTFEAVLNPDSSDGWFDAPHSMEQYNNPNGPEPPDAQAFMGQDAYNLASSVAGSAVDNYDMLYVVNNIQMLYGFATGQYPYDSLVVSGENSNNDSFFAVLGHELGHALTLQHVTMGPYDIVGNSPVLVHYGGWSKVYAGWVPQITDMPCIGGPCEITTTLAPLVRPGNNVLRIPFTNLPGKHFLGYFVECRVKSSFDAKIPEAGVIITKIDTIDSFEFAAKIVFPLGGNDYDDPALYNDAALAPGEVYVDDDQHITITYLSKDAYNNCTVKAVRGEINAPDPMIKKGSEAPSGAGYIEYGSRDIWIDSQENGWDVYPFGTEFSLEGGQGVPTGYGDPFWIDHENRIKFLVRNTGYSDAENVIADVYVTQPIMINIPGITCDGPEQKSAELIASVEIDHLAHGGIYFGSVPYTPTTSASAQVRVVIHDYVGEITHSNNTAGETYASQYVLADVLGDLDMGTLLEALGPYSDSVLVQTEMNCLNYRQFRFVRRVISAIDKKDWVMNFKPFEVMQIPDEQMGVRLASLPPADAQPGDCEETLVELQTMNDDYFVPVNGFTFRSCVVAPTELTCSTPKDALDLGSRVVVSGALAPAAEGGAIALEFTSPKGESVIQNAKLKKDGSYELAYLPEAAGKWQVQAFWQGSDASAPAESETCAFEIKSGSPEFTLNHNVNCRLGPSTDYEVVTAGRIGDVIPVEARSKDALWLYGTMKGNRCWMSLELGELNVNPWTLPERQPPLLILKPTKVPSICGTYTTQAVCERHKDICKWVVQPTGLGSCKAR